MPVGYSFSWPTECRARSLLVRGRTQCGGNIGITVLFKPFDHGLVMASHKNAVAEFHLKLACDFFLPRPAVATTQDSSVLVVLGRNDVVVRDGRKIGPHGFMLNDEKRALAKLELGPDRVHGFGEFAA